jgi:hypothetical protein
MIGQNTDLQLYREPAPLSQMEKAQEGSKRLKLFEALSALREGKLPTNQQIVKIITRLQDSEAFKKERVHMSEDGQHFMKNFDSFLVSLKKVIDEKNDDEDLQQFIFHSRLVTKAARPSEMAMVSAPSMDEAAKGFQKASNIARMLITNSEFRDFLYDLSDLLQDSLAGFEEEPQNWEKPRSYSFPERGDETLPVNEYYEPEEPPLQRGSSHKPTQSLQATIGVQESRIGGMSGAPSGRGNVEVQGHRESFEESFTPERRERLAKRLQKVMLSIQDNHDFQDSIEYIMTTLSNLQKESVKNTGGVKKRRDANLRAANHDLRHLIEKFTGGGNIEPLKNSFTTFADAVEDDFYLRDYLSDLAQFSRRSYGDRKFVEHRDYVQKTSDMINRGRALLIENYREETNDLLTHLSRMTNALKNDTTSREFASTFKALVNDVLYDDEGNLSLKADLIQDLSTILLPLAVKQVKVIPIPRIEHNDHQWHIIIENLILTSDNFLPNVMEVKLKTAAVIGLRRDLDSTFSSSFTLNFFQIYADVTDVPFYYKRKSGFPRMSDWGVANVFLGGQGMTIIVKLGFDKDSKTKTLFVRKVKVYIDDLRIQLKAEKHDAVYRLLAPMINSLVKKQITSAIEETVKDWVSTIDEQITPLKSKVGSQSLSGWLSSLGPKPTKKSKPESESESESDEEWKSGRFDRALEV